jgi:RHS repeat-associated protein
MGVGMNRLLKYVKATFFVIAVIVFYNIVLAFWFGSWEFERELGNDYVIHGNNPDDIHIADDSDIRNFVDVSNGYQRGVGRFPGIINIPKGLENRTSLVVPSKIILLGQSGDIVYGLNASEPYMSDDLPSAYFGWFVLDTKHCKCWLGLTEEDFHTILYDYQIEQPRFQRSWEICFVWTRSFTGQVLDGETGLMLYRNRYHHAGIGRFVSRDPIGYRAGDMNVYRYVFNKSNSFVDPQGSQQFPPIYNPGDVYGQIPITLPSVKIKVNVPKGKKQHPRKPFETNGCTNVPDNIAGINFLPACNAHDICYETCGASKSDCDNQFFVDLFNICTKSATPQNEAFCRNAAALYRSGVENLADDAYKESQDGWCVDKCYK